MSVNRQKIIQNRHYYKNRLNLILPHLHLDGASVLDLGCGEMILYSLVKDQIKSYLGIDRIPFSNSEQFLCGNILDESVLNKYSGDFVFLLGVLDHLSLDEKRALLETCKDRYNQAIIISQRNPVSFINIFYLGTSPIIDIDYYFKNKSITKLYLFKFPFSGAVFNLSNCNNWLKKLYTEIIYIVSDEIFTS